MSVNAKYVLGSDDATQTGEFSEKFQTALFKDPKCAALFFGLKMTPPPIWKVHRSMTPPVPKAKFHKLEYDQILGSHCW